jgi:hypothetical protein
MYGNNLRVTDIDTYNHERAIFFAEEDRSAECSSTGTTLQADNTSGVVGLLGVYGTIGSGSGKVLYIRGLLINDVERSTTGNTL